MEYILGKGTFHNDDEATVYVECVPNTPDIGDDGSAGEPGFAFFVAECESPEVATALVAILNTLDDKALEPLRKTVHDDWTNDEISEDAVKCGCPSCNFHGRPQDYKINVVSECYECPSCGFEGDSNFQDQFPEILNVEPGGIVQEGDLRLEDGEWKKVPSVQFGLEADERILRILPS